MGGFGNGWQDGKKRTIEECTALNINRLVRDGVLDHSSSTGTITWTDHRTGETTGSLGYEVNLPERWLRLHYVMDRDGERFDYRVGLTTSSLPWGGVRWWFICPLHMNGQACGRRVGKLYRPSGGRYYGCRYCYDLTYRTCQKAHTLAGQFQASRRAEIAEELRAERNEQRRRRRKNRNWA